MFTVYMYSPFGLFSSFQKERYLQFHIEHINNVQFVAIHGLPLILIDALSVFCDCIRAPPKRGMDFPKHQKFWCSPLFPFFRATLNWISYKFAQCGLVDCLISNMHLMESQICKKCTVYISYSMPIAQYTCCKITYPNFFLAKGEQFLKNILQIWVTVCIIIISSSMI